MKDITLFKNLRANHGYLWYGLPKVLKELKVIEKEIETIDNSLLRNCAIDSLYSIKEDCLCYSFFETFPYVDGTNCAVFISSLLALSAYLKAVCSRKELKGTECSSFMYGSFLDSVMTAKQPCNYYFKCPYKNDGGYLDFLVGRIRESLSKVPYIGVIRPDIEEFAFKYFSFYVNLFTSDTSNDETIMSWANSKNDRSGLLTCMEYAAACSGLSVIIALYTAGYDPYTGPDTVKDISYFYFPWVNCLFSILESYINSQSENDEECRNIDFGTRYANQKIFENRILFLQKIIFDNLKVMTNSHLHKKFISLFIPRFLSDYRAHIGINKITTENILDSIKDNYNCRNYFYRFIKAFTVASVG